MSLHPLVQPPFPRINYVHGRNCNKDQPVDHFRLHFSKIHSSIPANSKMLTSFANRSRILGSVKACGAKPSGPGLVNCSRASRIQCASSRVIPCSRWLVFKVAITPPRSKFCVHAHRSRLPTNRHCGRSPSPRGKPGTRLFPRLGVFAWRRLPIGRRRRWLGL